MMVGLECMLCAQEVTVILMVAEIFYPDINLTCNKVLKRDPEI